MSSDSSVASIGALLDAAPDAMMIIDRSGRVVQANAHAEALFGYSRGELEGKPVDALAPDGSRRVDPDRHQHSVEDVSGRPAGTARLEVYGRRKDGTEFPAEVSLGPLERDDGPVVIATIRDGSSRTERKKIETERAKLAHAEETLRIRDEFLCIASHELRTPMSALRMQVDSILRGIAKMSPEARPERIARKVEAIGGAMTRLNTLIGHLLDISRITAGRLDLQLEEVDLAQLVQKLAGQFQDELAQAGCELKLHADTAVIGYWDSFRIEQIVTNLLSNAAKYGRGKPVEVDVSQVADGVARLVVRDYGIGIAPEHQSRIFERFERLVSTRNYGGFGLGLWIVRQIIQAHHGVIHVWSEPGAGSVFTVDLPQISPEERAPIDSGPVTQPRICVMLVDDDAMIRAAFAEAIEDEGVPVVTAGDGVEALALLRAGLRPRVIFLDLMMPGMDGAAFRAEQRRDPDLASIPVVICSAATHAAEQAASLQATHMLSKPLDLSAMLSIIARHTGPHDLSKGDAASAPSSA